VVGTEKAVAANPERLDEHRRYSIKLWDGSCTLHDRRAESGRLNKDNCYGCIVVCNRYVRDTELDIKLKSLCGPPTVFQIIAAKLI
jgi:hypothetical protein